MVLIDSTIQGKLYEENAELKVGLCPNCSPWAAGSWCKPVPFRTVTFTFCVNRTFSWSKRILASIRVGTVPLFCRHTASVVAGPVVLPGSISRGFALLHRLAVRNDPLRQHGVALLQEVLVVAVSEFVQCSCLVTVLLLRGCPCAKRIHDLELFHPFCVECLCDSVPLPCVFRKC